MSDANDGEEQGQALGELIEALRDRDDVRLPEVLPEHGEPKLSWIVRAMNVLINRMRTQREIQLPDVPEGGFGMSGGEDEDEDDALPEMDTVPFTMTGAGVNVHQHAGLTGIVAETPTANEEQPIAGVDAGTGIAVMNESLVGRIPSRVYNICRRWQLTGVSTAGTAVWRQVNLMIDGYNPSISAAAVGVPSPVFGKVTGLIVNVDGISAGHEAGVVDFYVYNRTTTSATDSPQIDNLDPLSPTSATGYGVTWADGLAVSYADMLELWCLCATVSKPISFEARATFIIEEQCAYVVTGTLVPDATGVYVRNGQYGGKPCAERVDGAYWKWWNSGLAVWMISTTKGSATNTWARNSSNPVGAYTASGTYTGTATTAAQADKRKET